MKRLGNFESSSYAGLDKLITRVFADTAPKAPADAAYLFAETADNEFSVFAVGFLIYKLGWAKRIGICSYPSGRGYPGFKSWKAKLVKLGISAPKIFGVPLSSDYPVSTHSESLGLVRYAKRNGWRTIYIVAPPIHQLRAFVTTVANIKKEKSPLRIYNFVGLPQSWEEHVLHSQGKQKGTRSALLGKELRKIEKYYKQGDLVSAKEAVKYLNARDRASRK